MLLTKIKIIIILIEYKPELEIKRLVINLLNDLKETCNYYPDNVKNIYNVLNKYNKNNLIDELKEFQRILFNHLNELALPELVNYLNRLQFLLPFKLKLPLPT